jgi:hypothetical protein
MKKRKKVYNRWVQRKPMREKEEQLMNKERRGAPRNVRPYSGDEREKPVAPAPQQVNISAASTPQASPDAERFIVGIRALVDLAAKYLTLAPASKCEVLRRAVAPADLATLKTLIADSDQFIAAHPAGHALWRPLLQQLSRQGGPATFREVVAALERSKPLLIEHRMERIAAVAKKLSHVIEMFPQRPFAEAFKQLTPAEQEVFNQAVFRREWSDLFLSPFAQKVLQESRPAAKAPPHVTSVAAARRGRSASFAAKHAHTTGTPPPNRNRQREK